MQSSPGTPTGHGCILSSRTRTGCWRWAADENAVLGLSTRQHVDQIVVSVGPYMFRRLPCPLEKALGQVARHRFAAAEDLEVASPRHPASISSRHVAGVACMTVACEDSSSPFNRSPSIAVSRSARTTVAPAVKGSKSSRPAMSNDSVVTATILSSAFSPGVCAMLARKLTRGTVRYLYSLGSSRRSRGVDHVRDVVGSRRRRHRRAQVRQPMLRRRGRWLGPHRPVASPRRSEVVTTTDIPESSTMSARRSAG